ncbi:MAG: CDP-alcohol phosphatidyltransferase family protein [Patescibacteria group bacterium]
MEKARHNEVTHRTSKLRLLQDIFAPYIPGMLSLGDRLGAFPNTKIHDARMGRRDIEADEITLTQLQMTGHICDAISERTFYPGFNLQYILTSMLDAADGPVARLRDTVTKEGGIKDAAVDRLSEIMITRLIGRELGLPDSRVHELQIAFQLSTLTKAACEMTGTRTSEGGMGSMIERRKSLFFIMNDLIHLKKIPKSFTPVRNKITARIEKKLQSLIKGSRNRAQERIKSIAENTKNVNAPEDPDSTAADEARKYAGIVYMNTRMGIDMVAELNELADDAVVFPSLESLKESQPYIAETLTNAEKFLDEALQIAGFN